MKDVCLHSVIVKYDSLEILSADTEFYAHVGTDRFYSSFEKLMPNESAEKFQEVVKARDTKPFVVDIIREKEEVVSVYMRVTYNTTNMTVEIEPIDELRDGQELYRKLNDLNRELLSLHNDMIYTYDSEADSVKLYTPDFKRCTRTYSLEGFKEEIRGNIGEDEYTNLEQFMASLQGEAGSFVYNFTGSILTDMATCKKCIVKGFSVENFEGITAVGYIHRASNKGEATYTIEKDALTGTYSKREIANIARKTIEVDHQKNVAICIIDIDYFKNVNDNFGHMMGDVVLKDVAGIIMDEVGSNGVVGRFGGDEFFVMFYDVENMENNREKLRSIKNRVSTTYPESDDGFSVTVTLSIGCAVYPKDADNYDDLFSLADYCLYLAKDRGRNRYVIYDAALHGTLEETKEYFKNNRRVDTRKDMAMGDVLCMIDDLHRDDKNYTPEMLVDDLVENLFVERIVCLSGEGIKYRCMSGIQLETPEVINECSKIIGEYLSDEYFKDDVFIVDDIERVKNISNEVYSALKRLRILSVIIVRFKDAAGKDSLVTLEMTTKKFSWNQNQSYNYRTIARMFSRFDL